jgi:hypothetical protein
MEEEYEVFKYPVPKLPKLFRKKLGKEKAWGLFDGDNVITLDERLKGKKELIVTIHEFIHWLHPEWTENQIIKDSETIAEFLWKQHYRKVDNDDK